MIDDGADTKQIQLINISVILVMSRDSIELKSINLAF
jgi:hypothetical protein